MPLYDTQCTNPECLWEGEQFRRLDEELFPCPKCSYPCKILITGGHKDWFRPHINEHFDGTPIEVTSRKHLKELCKKHGVTSRAL